MDWRLTTGLLCLYGFLKELRPSEPFLTEYLIDPRWPNVTLSEAYRDVYPVWTYSYLAILVAVFLLTDFLRYKPVIVLEGFAYVATWITLLWGKGVPTMQLMQVFYGLATSTEVAYYTYIYAKVDPKHFQKVTSFTRVSLLLGRFLSGVLAQVLTSVLGWMDYRQLNVFTLASVSAATVVSFALPSVETTQYFYKGTKSEALDEDEERQLNDSTLPSPKSGQLVSVLNDLKEDFVAAYSSSYVAKWSLWWALGMCGNFQVGNYIQPLWETIAPVQETGEAHIYNGAVEATTTLAGAFLSFLFGFVRLNWRLVGEPALFLLSAGAGAVLAGMAAAEDVKWAYAGYVAFRALYQMLITVASYEVAQNIRSSSYGLVFGVNTFAALAFQTALTLAVADDAVGFALRPRQQFFAYGAFWACVGAVFLLIFCLEVRQLGGWRGYAHRARTEGIWIGGDGNGAPADRPVTSDEERRDVPLGCTEPQ